MVEQSTGAPSKSMLILPFVPPVLALMANVFPLEEGGNFVRAMLLLFAILLCVEYAHQLSYIKHQLGKSIKSQKILTWAALLIPAGAALAGDMHGMANFGSNTSGGGLVIGLIGGLFAAFVVVNILAIVNVVTILTKGKYQAVDLISTVLQALLWLGLFMASYFIHGLMYALRDPSTE